MVGCLSPGGCYILRWLVILACKDILAQGLNYFKERKGSREEEREGELGGRKVEFLL